MARHDPDLLSRQQFLISTAVGEPGSGAVRYAAAMSLYQQGELSAEMLEIYRRCCKLDYEDPVDLARFEQADAYNCKTTNL